MRPRKLVESWVEAFNRGDASEMAAFYHDDAVNHQVARDPVAVADASRRMLEQGCVACHARFRR